MADGYHWIAITSRRSNVKTIAIIGRGKTKQYIDFSPEKTYWAMNDNAMNYDYLSAAFEVHPDWRTRYEGVAGCEGYVEWLRTPHPFPIFMLAADSDVPSCSVLKLYSRKFFTTTTAYAIAKAITREPDVIELWGIERDPAGEYSEAEASIMYWIGVAEGQDIEVRTHDECQLLKRKVYPFGYDMTLAEKEHKAREMANQWARWAGTEALVRCKKCGALIETTKHCDNCGTFEPLVNVAE